MVREVFSYIAMAISAVAGVVSIINYVERKTKRRSNHSEGERRFFD